MNPLWEFIKGSFLSFYLILETFIFKLFKGNFPKNLFLEKVNPQNIGTDVKVIKSTCDSTFIAKVHNDGSIKDNEFKILIATDMHVGDDPEKRNKTFLNLYKSIELVKPDLVIFTGDIILSDFQQLDSLQFAKFMERIGIYWAVIFGNHEARKEKEFHKYFMLKNMAKYPHCLSKIGDDSLFGYGNFFINILNSQGKVYKSLAFFDSGRNIEEKYREEYNLPKDLEGYDFIKENQITWYLNTIKNLEKDNGKVKSLLFMHIPLPEYNEVMSFDPEEKPIPFGKAKKNAEVISGEMHERVSSSPYNSGLFERALEVGAQGFFTGHDHMNDFWAVYKNAYLIYNQFSGYEEYSYGETYNLPQEKWNQGVLQLTLNSDDTIALRRYLYKDFL